MVIIIKKLVPVYKATDSVPKKYLNLRKAVFVTSFKHLYPNIPEILIREYGLKPPEKIVVFYTREVSLPHFARYRLKFRKVYSGPVMDFWEYMEKVRRGKIDQGATKNGQHNSRSTETSSVLRSAWRRHKSDHP